MYTDVSHTVQTVMKCASVCGCGVCADFTTLQQAVMSGSVTHVTDVPGGKLVWALSWDGMLTAELAWHQQTPGVPPDGVIIHRKQRCPDDNTLVYDVRCLPGSGQVGLGSVAASPWMPQRVFPARTCRVATHAVSCMHVLVCVHCRLRRFSLLSSVPGTDTDSRHTP